MKKLVEKIRAIEQETSSEKGSYSLFALFLREDASDKWDILVSADWIDNNKQEAFKYLAEKIQKAFTRDDLSQISRIVIIEKHNPALPALQQAVSVEHGAAELKDSILFGLEIKHAFLNFYSCQTPYLLMEIHSNLMLSRFCASMQFQLNSHINKQPHHSVEQLKAVPRPLVVLVQ